MADSFVSAVVRAESLEHFHIFRKMSPSDSSMVKAAEGVDGGRGPPDKSRGFSHDGRSNLASRETAEERLWGGQEKVLADPLEYRSGSMSRSADPGGPLGSRRNRPALELHTDVGLFIVMTAAEVLLHNKVVVTDGGGGGDTMGHHDGNKASSGRSDMEVELIPVDDSNSDSGLRIELPSGEVVRPLFPRGSLLVMNGEGGARWIKAERAAERPFAPPHEVVMPSFGAPFDYMMEGENSEEGGSEGAASSAGNGGDEVVRVWFGRMFLPPSDARLQLPPPSTIDGVSGPSAAASLTFGEYRRKTYESFRDGVPYEASSAGEPSRAYDNN